MASPRHRCRAFGLTAPQLLILLASSITIWGLDAEVTGVVAAIGNAADAAKPADLAACPDLRIAIVNGVPYHYEVLAGLLHTFRPYARNTVVYINRQNADGSWDILRRFRVTFQKLTRTLLSSIAHEQPTFDLVILVSPDYELDANAELLRHIKRRLTVAIVHNSDFNETQRLISVAAGGGSAVKLVTLAPHTASSLAASAGRPVDWALPTYPFRPQTNCMQASEVDLLGLCLVGFSIQGKFSSLRRNYSAIWEQMQQRKEQLTSGNAARLFRMSVVGKGQDERLHLPPELEPLVTVHRRLPYRGFYESIHHTFALIPALGSAKYYTDKFSSSILTSLIAGTPMVADRRFLSSYSMFGKDSVYLQGEGEHEVDVMLRVLGTPAASMMAVRRAHLEVRRRMNERATAFYAEILAGLCSSSSEGGGAGGR